MQNEISLILNSKVFTIQSDFRTFHDIDQEIFLSLSTKKQYEVKSKVSDKVFQSFINYWVKDDLPVIRLHNLHEFEQLSDEFDIMKPLIQLFRKSLLKPDISIQMSKNKELVEYYIKRTQNLEKFNQSYQQIIQYIFKNPGMETYSNFDKKRNRLYKSSLYEPKMINLFTQKMVKKDDILYIINEQEKTAGVFNQDTKKSEIFIPKSIIENSQEYLIKTVHDQAFNFARHILKIEFAEDSEITLFGDSAFVYTGITEIKIPKHVTEIGDKCFKNSSLQKVEFENGSELKIIGKYAFDESEIADIEIPPNVIELRKFWSHRTKRLKEIKISPDNKNFINYESKFIIGKCDPNSDIFDLLVFVNTESNEVLIPNFIKRIGSLAFEKCENLSAIKFSEDSQLKIIDSNAFISNTLESIMIPSSVEIINKDAFSSTKKLTKFEIMPNQTNFLNYNSDFILKKSDPKSDIFDVLIFARRDITNAIVPSYIKRIGSFAFAECKKLQSIQFCDDSQLLAIETCAFLQSSLSAISIPKNVIKFGDCIFYNCNQLVNINIPNDSELKIIGINSFALTSIEQISIPSNIVSIDGIFFFSYSLNNIQVIPRPMPNKIFSDGTFVFKKSNPKSDIFDVLFFAPKNIRIAKIPPFVTKIGSEAFYECKNLRKIEFTKDSKLKVIESNAFYDCTQLMPISFPSNLEVIRSTSFMNCRQLKYVIFPTNSKLRTIENLGFANCHIEFFSVPSTVSYLGNWFLGRNTKVQIVEFDENSKLSKVKLINFSNNQFSKQIVKIMVPNTLRNIVE